MKATEFQSTGLMLQSETPKLFFTHCDKYLFNLSNGLEIQEVNSLVEGRRKNTVYLPIDVDCEFQTYSLSYKELLDNMGLGSLTLTVQMKGVAQREGLIFAHWDLVNSGKTPRHQNLRSDFAVVDYLQALGIKASISIPQTRAERAYLGAVTRRRVLHVVLFAHFAIADFPRLFRGYPQASILEMCRKKVDNSVIRQKRRLTTEYHYKSVSKEYIRPRWLITLDNVPYSLQITVVDSGALHGPISLDSLAQNTGTILQSKHDLSLSDKQNMLTTYFEKSSKFDKYSLGDLSVYQILANNNEKFRAIYRALGYEHRAQIPNLSIGATIANFFKQASIDLFSSALDKFGLEEKDLIDLVCAPSSAQHLIDRENTTGGLNAKVLGGRCYNPRPRDTKDFGIIADTDISGCYGEGMRNQTYPYGNPVIIDYPRKSKHNDYLTLRDFFKQYQSDLVPGLWQVWFSVMGKLPTNQDFFNSYLPPKKWADLKSDSDTLEENWLELPDQTKIYSHQIENGLLTHDGYQWLTKIASRTLRNYILDNSYIVTAMFYPASERVNSPEELIEKLLSQTEKNTSEVVKAKGKTEVINTDRDCKAWYGVNLGEFLVNKLLTQRNTYKPATKLFGTIRRLRAEGLGEGEIVSQLSDNFKAVEQLTGIDTAQILEDSKASSKHPLDSLFKLCTNTLYGVTVSKYFKTSNTVVGNNITARARALAWYMEKGLYTHNSITDGGAFNINRVAYSKPGRRLNENNTVLTNRKTSKELDKNHLRYAPIGGYERIDWVENSTDIRFVKGSEVVTMKGPQAKEFIDTLIPQHLREQFPGIDVLSAETTDIKGNLRVGQFGFETKGLVKQSAYHGQSNYIFRGGFHELYKGDAEFIAMRSYRKNEGVVRDFLSQLLEHPGEINRQSPFEKTQIIKVGDYKQRYNSFYSNHNFIPGDTLFTCGLLRELSLSQFTFKNRLQRETWEKHIIRLKEKNGQSLEMYFETLEGKLKYQNMVETVDLAIAQGVSNFKEFIDKHRNKAQTEHPSFIDYQALKQKLAQYGIMNHSLEDDNDEWGDLEPVSVDYGEWGEQYFSESVSATLEDLEGLEFEL
jgi:hypothetical protein